MPAAIGREVWHLEATAPALVLGSAQDPEVADPDALRRTGAAMARRRSGGGAVLVVPGSLLWIDVVVPRGDPRWEDDVGRAFLWLGQAWVEALDGLGVDADVYDGAHRAGRWGSLVCFGGRGTGEVLVDGRKLVGISQRRTRAGSRFQCAVLRWWRPDAVLDVLRLDPPVRARGATELADVAVGLEDVIGPATCVGAPEPDPLGLLRAQLERALERW